MSTAGRCIACSTSSGMLVGPGIASNCRPARTAMYYLLAMHSLAIKHDLAGDDRHLGDGIAQNLEPTSQRILREHRDIREFTRFERTLEILLERPISAPHGCAA